MNFHEVENFQGVECTPLPLAINCLHNLAINRMFLLTVYFIKFFSFTQKILKLITVFILMLRWINHFFLMSKKWF